MGINVTQLRTKIIRPTLQKMKMWSRDSEELLLGTCAQESRLGTYITQMKGAPARGIYQMESKATSGSPVFEEVLKMIVPKIKTRCSFLKEYDFTINPERLVYDLRFATVTCRLQYWRFKEKIPDFSDINALGMYWKKYYNSIKGKGTVEEFVENYNKLVRT